jgi:hypothetical protein
VPLDVDEADAVASPHLLQQRRRSAGGVQLVRAVQLPSTTLAAHIESNKMVYVLPAGR